MRTISVGDRVVLNKQCIGTGPWSSNIIYRVVDTRQEEFDFYIKVVDDENPKQEAYEVRAIHFRLHEAVYHDAPYESATNNTNKNWGIF